MTFGLSLTRYFTNDGVNAEFTLSWTVATHEAGAAAMTKFLAAPVPDLPPLGGETAWREMTDEEVKAYLAEKEADEKEAKLQRQMQREEDDEG